jgi:hypothetical protein
VPSSKLYKLALVKPFIEHLFFLLQQGKSDDTAQILKLAAGKYMSSHTPAAVQEAVEEVLHEHRHDIDEAMLCKIIMDIILQNHICESHQS